MDTPIPENFDADIAKVVAELPAPIKAFFASGKIRVVIKEIFDKYRLHVDAATIVEREILLLLLGINNPTEFVSALSEDAGLDEKTIDAVVQIVNDKVFKPIQNQMRQGPMPAPKPPQASVPSYQPPKPIFAAPQQPRPQMSAPRPIMPQAPRIGGGGAPPANLPGTDFGHLLADHEEKHFEVRGSAPMPAPVRVTLPAPMPPKPASEVKPEPKPLAKYSADPYRELTDEN